MIGSLPTVCRSFMPEADSAVSGWNHSLGKRLLDIAGSSGVLALAAPLMFVIAVAVKVSSPGSVFFRQERVGKDGAEFEILKFRTMYQSPADGGPGLTRKGDNRVTPVGRWLRRWKLDELPQFLNVLHGEMSLIGPRPDLPEFYATLSSARREILRVKPGITGWATLHFRDEESVLAGVSPEKMVDFYVSKLLPMKVDLDLSYARRANFMRDIGILARTLAAILPIGAKTSGVKR
jgi:lipopolysaccharide/colanic/teichoic acid biosynthesis glycosyltransferase